MNVLEIGCGIHRSGETTVAIDKIRTPQVDIVRDVAKRGIPFADNTFDQVRAYDVIEHIESYEDLIFLFNEIWRVLKPEGLFHFTTPNGVINSFAHMTHVRAFSAGSFEYLKDVGNPEFNHMREADGIVANFNIQFKSNQYGEQVIEGEFYAIK